MKLPIAVQEYLQEQAKRGGDARAKKLSAARRMEISIKANAAKSAKKKIEK